ncbi:MAG: hypothetical protein ACK4UJ_02125 [Leptonema sp. (in: bacteria)]
MNLAKLYRNFIENQDKELENFLILELYKETYRWFQNGIPQNQFFSDLLELLLEYEEPIEPKTLLDLGILELINAVDIYNSLEKDKSKVKIHLKHSLFSFLASLDEFLYRKIKNIEFTEIDFYIFEIIGGELPHISILNFLKKTKDIDVWIVIKYLEELLEEDSILDIIQSLIKNYDDFLDKYILLTYFIYRFFSKIEERINNHQKIDLISLPEEISYEELFFMYTLSKNLLIHNDIEMDFFPKISNSKLETVGLLCLLTLFEIKDQKINYDWIEVLERSLKNLWTDSKKSNSIKKYQPIPEFACNIIAFLPEEEQRNLLQLSRILILFFENINQYSQETFEEISDLLSIQSDLFEEELKFQLEYHKPKNLKRFSKCAFKINKKIVKTGNTFELIDLKEY